MKKYLLTIVLLLVFTPSVVFGVSSSQVQTQVQARKEAQNTGDALKIKIQEMKEAKDTLKLELKENILAEAKERAEKSIDRAISKYEKTKARIGNMPNISQENKDKIADEIDKVIQDLQNQKEKISNATTAEEVKAIMAEVKTQMREGYNAVKAAVSAIHATRLSEVTVRIEGVLDQLTTKVSSLKDGGVETSQMEALEEQAKENIESARAAILAEDYKGAKDSILAARKSLIELSQKIKSETIGEEE